MRKWWYSNEWKCFRINTFLYKICSALVFSFRFVVTIWFSLFGKCLYVFEVSGA